MLKSVIVDPIKRIKTIAQGAYVLSKYGVKSLWKKIAKSSGSTAVKGSVVTHLVQREAKVAARAMSIRAASKGMLDTTDDSVAKLLKSRVRSESTKVPISREVPTAIWEEVVEKVTGELANIDPVPLRKMADLSLPDLLPKTFDLKRGKLDLSRIVTNLKEGLIRDESIYKRMTSWREFDKVGTYGAPSIGELRSIARVRIRTQANWRFHDGIVRYGEAIAEQGMDADKILMLYFGFTLDEARHARTSLGFASYFQEGRFAGMKPSSVDDIWTHAADNSAFQFEGKEQPFEGLTEYIRDWNSQLDGPVVAGGVSIPQPVQLQSMLEKSPKARNGDIRNALGGAIQLQQKEMEMRSFELASMFKRYGDAIGADTSLARRQMGVPEDAAEFSAALDHLKDQIETIRHDFLESLRVDRSIDLES